MRHLTPHGKLMIGMILASVFAIFLFGFIAGVSVAVEQRRADTAEHNSVLILTEANNAKNDR